MKDKSIVIKLIQLLMIISLYYIYGNNSLFSYTITLSLYNIFSASFSHITLKEEFKKNNNNKFKILKYITIYITIICSLFVLLSILISDTIPFYHT